MTRVTPGTDGWIDVEGGRCRAVIELASPAEPVPQIILTPQRVRGRLLPGHTVAGDPQAPVIVQEGDIRQPGDTRYADFRCKQCAARTSVGPLGPDTLMLIEHEPGCGAYKRLLRQVPR
jgi:hypothetical protein